MSTFTKEQLIEKLQHRISVASGFPESEKAQMDLELARIALASLEAEPAIHRWRRVTAEPYGPYPWHYGNFICFSKPVDGIEDEYYYAAPPAPVSVPDERYQHLSELYHAQEKRLFKLAQRIKGASFDKYAYSPSQAIDVLESAIFGEREDECRAAMLQGAELVTTANKLRDAVETIRNSGIEIDAEKIFAERDALNAPVIPDGYCIMPLKLTADNGAKGALCGEFHVQYRIVCQSCVGEGCEDCNHTGGWDAEIPVGWDTIKRIHEAAVEACAMPAAPQQEVK
ncbi:hypothetical protein [Enterobacter hormaechei]|uniref:hypothetical protein n=1 Tax=Enterobacter hormaechei TaxID=158836 RepID=UPI0007354A81|nr:hypothetical protein [Enterobacter hormaechei]KTI85945.1 hypothetical protein ASU95_12770 [Enterobacter hormaechei subsp. hoffmannii]CZW99315.1 Uncharacterised protein [Enterobacter hormaechei]VAC26594.1 Uncharacterised protein [Enterobacter hormaechei]